MKKNKKMIVTLIIALIVTMSFTATAFAATYSVDWDFINEPYGYKRGTNRFTMTDNSIINHGQFNSYLGYASYIGIYNRDSGIYKMRKYWSGFSGLSAGSFYGEDGLISFAAKNATSVNRNTITGTYTF